MTGCGLKHPGYCLFYDNSSDTMWLKGKLKSNIHNSFMYYILSKIKLFHILAKLVYSREIT